VEDRYGKSIDLTINLVCPYKKILILSVVYIWCFVKV